MRVDSNPPTDSSFVAGFVSAILLGLATVVIHKAYQWLTSTTLAGVVSWWTSEQTITYVPGEVFSGLFGVLMVVLILFVIVSFMAFGPRVRT